MKYGVVFPTTELGDDPRVIRDYAQVAEALGYDYLLAYDHVLGAHPDRTPRLDGPYTHADPFREVLVLLGFLAAVTTRLELVTGALILPHAWRSLGASHVAVDTMGAGLATPQDHINAILAFRELLD